MDIREARPADAAGIRRVAERSWAVDYPNILHPENVGEAATEWYDEDLQAMVLADNEAGNAFYRAAGYEPIDEDETTIGGETYAETVYRRSD